LQKINLDTNDLFKLTRSLVFAELIRLRKKSDVFGEELALTPDSRFNQGALLVNEEERHNAALRVVQFFTLDQTCTMALLSKNTLGAWAGIIFERWEEKQDFITFLSSGSTGEPKPIKRHYCFLEQDARFLASLHGHTQRMITLVPPTHIYGFIFNILIPKVMGVSCREKRFLSPHPIAKALLPGDVLVGMPLYWSRFAQHLKSFPPGVQGTTSTSPCPAEVIRSLYAQGLDRMVEIYGSSESGAMGYRFNPDEPFMLLPTWERRGEKGFLRRFPDGSLSEAFYFQDQLQWQDEQRFFVVKRIDRAVQVAGINVYPAKISKIIKQCDLVADCTVRLMRPQEGDRLKAFIVLQDGLQPGQEVKQALRHFLDQALSHFERPKAIAFGDKLPRNYMGKLTDW
jgi:long-chain acyl-CoA synthetase